MPKLDEKLKENRYLKISSLFQKISQILRSDLYEIMIERLHFLKLCSMLTDEQKIQAFMKRLSITLPRMKRY